MIVSPQEAFSAGLVDELAAPDQVVQRAIAWCNGLLALPSKAMLDTRSRARADLVELFGAKSQDELRSVSETWWSSEAQTTLRAVVQRLAKKAP
jgi:enoyl-CoA hydratase/carnithine racemase